MKPTWNNAPSWARYLAMDADGQWTWFEEEPEFGNRMWLTDGGRIEAANDHKEKARDTLEARPKCKGEKE